MHAQTTQFGDPIVGFRDGRDHDDAHGGVALVLANEPRHGDAVHLGHDQVGHDHLGQEASHQGACFDPVGGRLDRGARPGGAHRSSQETSRRRIVLNHQHLVHVTSPAGGRKEANEHVQNRLSADGFGNVVVHAHGETLLPIPLHGVGGHRDDGQVTAFLRGRRLLAHLPDASGGLVPVHARHLAIHEDHVKRFLADALDRLLAVRRHGYGAAEVAQNRQCDLLVDVAVFHEKDPDVELRRCAAYGRRAVRGRVGRLAREDRALTALSHRPQRGERVHQLGIPHRLGQRRGHAQLLQPLSLRGARGRREYHEKRFAERRVLPDGAGEILAVHLGHVIVREHDLKGRLLAYGLAHQAQRLLGRGDAGVGDIPARQAFAQDLTIHRVVVDYEHSDSRQIRGGTRLDSAPTGAQKRQREVERRPLSQRGLHPDRAPHHLHELLADRQPQPGPSELSGGRGVHLGELVENRLLVCLGDSDPGVGDRYLDERFSSVALQAFHVDEHVAPLGELDRIAREVIQDLSNAGRIADEASGHIGRAPDDQIEALGLAAHGQELRHVFDHALEVERLGLDVELARLDLREIQNIVDDVEQRLGRAMDRGRIVALLGRHFRVEQKLRHPHHAVHGGADFVGHVGKEGTLGPVGGVGGQEQLAGLVQRLFQGVGPAFAVKGHAEAVGGRPDKRGFRGRPFAGLAAHVEPEHAPEVPSTEDRHNEDRRDALSRERRSPGFGQVRRVGVDRLAVRQRLVPVAEPAVPQSVLERRIVDLRRDIVSGPFVALAEERLARGAFVVLEDVRAIHVRGGPENGQRVRCALVEVFQADQERVDGHGQTVGETVAPSKDLLLSSALRDVVDETFEKIDLVAVEHADAELLDPTPLA